MMDSKHPEERPTRVTGWRWLLLVPFVATLWVPFYNTRFPQFVGLPFFYWYQLLWVLLTGAIVFVVYRLEN